MFVHIVLNVFRIKADSVSSNCLHFRFKANPEPRISSGVSYCGQTASLHHRFQVKSFEKLASKRSPQTKLATDLHFETFRLDMFYSANTIENCLKCEFCQHKLTGVVKLIPDCGNFICGECYDALRDTMSETGQYKCLGCQSVHSMPVCGLADVKGLMKMLQLEPEEKGLSHEAKTLKALIEQAQDKVSKLKSLDRNETVNSACDRLQLEVMEMIDSAVKHVNLLREAFVEEINHYRDELLGSDSTVSNQDLMDKISKDIGDMAEAWTPYFTRISVVADMADIKRALKEVKTYELKLSQLEKKATGRAFNNYFLKLKNKLAEFFESNGPLGELVRVNCVHSDHVEGF